MKTMVLPQRGQLQEDAIEFWVGRDEKGRWIARDAEGREGGIFVSRAEAMKFVQTARLRGQGVARNFSVPLNLWQ